MKLKLTLRRHSGPTDIVVDVDAAATVAELADAICRADPAGHAAQHPTLSIEGVSQTPLVLEPNLSIAESRLGSGQLVQVVEGRPSTATSSVVLSVLSGPDAGARFELSRGLNSIGRGRDCAVRLTDPLVSNHHAKIIVGDTVELVDDNSSNGILVGGDQVQRVELASGDVALIGDSMVSLTGGRAHAGAVGTASGSLALNRSPRVDPQYEGEELEAPEPPTLPTPNRFPLVTALVPLLLAPVLWAATKNAASMAFILLSPVMIVGSFWENKRSARKQLAESTELFRQNLAELVVELRQAHDAERVGRCSEQPATAEVVAAVRDLSPLVWTRRPEHESFLRLRLGLGRQPSRTKVETKNSRNTPVDLQRELTATVAPYVDVDHVPIVAAFDESGSLGISGPEHVRSGVARGIVAQLVGLHSPAEVVLVAFASPRSASQWDWLKWLPHVGGDHSPLGSAPLATTAPACNALAAELNDVIQLRSATDSAGDKVPSHPAIVAVVEDDAPVERSALVQVMEAGREVGVHVIWMASATSEIPAAARVFLQADEVNGVMSGNVVIAESVHPVVVEQLDLAGAEWLARRLAPVIDAGARSDTASDVPNTVSFLAEAGADLAERPQSVIERWTESNSLVDPTVAPRRLKRDNTLRALVGRSALDPLTLDLRTQGPHALVGGTTGAGKSEFLQTWILGMATSHSPQRVTFLFVDYKGGAAFADCISLPHSVGLVTDLNPHLVQRALISLNAELRYREHVLNRARAKDLLEMERRGDPDCPPSLVIVVDEFAALVQEVPEFVDGVVNVAQRGRSLGLHLILATQRPAGVIKDNLRANTNLRIALRMADEDDSKDVVGTAQAGTFDPSIPGRGIAKTGPGRLTLFQSGYLGGWTSDEPPPADVRLATLAFGPSEIWEVPAVASSSSASEESGPNDIQRLVANIQEAARIAAVAEPRRPWLPELAEAYDLAALPLPRRDSELVYGVVDQPDQQQQGVASFKPDVDGNMAVFGTGGSGKSTFLRTLAVSAGLTARGGPCLVYALDFGSRGLKMLETLPHVGAVIGADDTERTARVLSKLRDTVDERATRFAAVNAGSVEEYRRIADKPDEPRVLLLLDGFSAFRNAYEVGPMAAVYEQLTAIATDGRPVGVHVVLTADRLGAVPAALSSTIQRRLALRLSNEMDESMLGVPKGGFAEGSPPGRGFVENAEIQVAVFGGSVDVALQAGSIDRLADSMRRAGAAEAPPIERLPDRVELGDLPSTIDGTPTFAMADDTLAAAGFHPDGMLLVAGPSASGRSTAVLTMITSLKRMRPGTKVAYFGSRRSPLSAQEWDRRAVGAAEWSTLAQELTEELAAGSVGPEQVIVLDGLGEFLNSEADYALQDLLKACRSNGIFVIADGETSDVGGSWPLLQAVKAARHGLVLQPDQTDGDSLFRTSFPRISRADFPQGRGMYVRGGRARRVQVAVADDAAGGVLGSAPHS